MERKKLQSPASYPYSLYSYLTFTVNGEDIASKFTVSETFSFLMI